MEGGRIGILSLSEESCSVWTEVTLLMHSTHAFSCMQHAELSLLAISVWQTIFVSIIPHLGPLEGRGSKEPFKKRYRYLTYFAK